MKHQLDYVLEPSMSQDVMRLISANFVQEAMKRAKDKRTILQARDETRSLAQNRYLFALYQMISDHMRETHGIDHGHEAWHEYFKLRACPHTVEHIRGETIRCYPTTTKLTKRQFSQYIARVHEICAEEYDLVLPEPEWNWQLAEDTAA